MNWEGDRGESLMITTTTPSLSSSTRSTTNISLKQLLGPLVFALVVLNICRLSSPVEAKSSLNGLDVINNNKNKNKTKQNSENEKIISANSRNNADKQPAYDDNIQDYLIKYGYLPQSNREMSNLRRDDVVQLALIRLQEFAGLEPTGILDTPTQKLISTKRCGLPDVPYDGLRRRKRYVLHGSKWHKLALTYKVQNSARSLDMPRTRRTLYDAFSLWSKSSALSFQEIAGESADIVVKFASREHDDSYPFDGPNVVLAHAFFPAEGIGGDVHFDDDERWTDAPHQADQTHSNSVNLLATAAHEIGHSLGLGHSKVKISLMYPYYRPGLTNVQLEYDDIMAVQRLYGIGSGGRPASPRPIPTTTESRRDSRNFGTKKPPVAGPPTTTATSAPEPCSPNIDALARIRNEIFVFKDKFYWRFSETGALTESPKEIVRFWYGLPQNITKIDSIYERLDKDRVIIFVGRLFYEFSGNRLRHKARDISDLGLPDDVDRIDAAFVWDYNERTYFFSGKRYWRFDENKRIVEPDYPRDVESVWINLPSDLDAAFTDKTGTTYFFKEDMVYKFNNYFMRVEKSYPRSLNNFWSHCTTKKEGGQNLELINKGHAPRNFLHCFLGRLFLPIVILMYLKFFYFFPL